MESVTAEEVGVLTEGDDYYVWAEMLEVILGRE